MRAHRRITGACLAAWGVAGIGSAQDRPVFRSGTAIVEVTVIVRDASGAFVSDLAIGDFEVREGDEPRRLETLYVVTPPKGPAAPPSDAGTAPTRAAARTFVFVFDTEHISPGAFTRARDAALKFASGRLAPTDLAGVAAVAGTGKGQLNTDRAALADALRGLRPSSASASRSRELREYPRITSEAEAIEIGRGNRETLKRAVDRACAEQERECQTLAGLALVEQAIDLKGRTFTTETRAAAQRSIATLDRLARALAALPGRKTAIWFSEGSFSDELTEQARQAAYRASQAGVAIYAVDPRGLGRRIGGTLEQYAVDEIGTDVRLGAAEDSSVLLAAGSGGTVTLNENRLERALQRIEEDTSTYYVLGYAAPDAVDRREYRTLNVRVRRPGLSVRARHGYMAPGRAVMVHTSTKGAADTLPPLVPLTLSALPARFTDEAAAPVSIVGTVVETTAGVTGTARVRPGAVDAIRAVGREQPAEVAALAERGWNAYERGDVEAAVGPLLEAATHPDARPWVLYALGLCQAALGRHADAAASWERVRAAAAEFPTVYMDLAEAYTQLSNLTAAMDALRDAERRWPSDPEVHNAIGVIHARRGALDEAIAAFAKAVGTAPADPLGHFNTARAFELRFERSRRYVSSQGAWVASATDLDKAIEHYRRCIALGGPYESQAAAALSRLEWAKLQRR